MKSYPKGGSAVLALLLIAGLVPVRADVDIAGSEVNEMKDLGKRGQFPKLLKPVQPVYPYTLARAGVVGDVTLSFIIDKEGGVRNPQVTECNNPWFERPAIDAILQWKFSPGMVDGKLVYVRANQRIEFRLDAGGKTPELWRVVQGKDHNNLPEKLRWDEPPKPKKPLSPSIRSSS